MVDSIKKKRWSSLATNFGVAVVTFATGIVAPWASTFIPPHQPSPGAHYANVEAGTLRARILEAKARGENTVELGVLSCGWEIGDLQEALSRDTVVLAELVEKKTYEGSYGLHTWYRFKIKETLVERAQPLPNLHKGRSGPSDMHPIAEDEFLIHETNGQMEIAGVTVVQRSNGAEYREAQTYLLFLWIDPSQRIATRTGTDPLGVFLVDRDGNLNSYINEPYPLKTELNKRFKNSVNNMRQALKKQRRA